MNNRNNNSQNYRRNNERNNRPQRLDNIHEEVKIAKQNLPYTFSEIKLSDQEEKEIYSQKQSFLNPELINGNLDCSLQVLNALIVGNEHKPLTEQDTEIKPLEINNEKGGNVIHISPYTLKGCIRSFIASYLNEPMRRVENEAFFHRPNQYPVTNANLKRTAGIIEVINPDGSLKIRLLNSPFCFTEKRPFISVSNNTLHPISKEYNYNIQYRKIIMNSRGRIKDEMYFFPYRNGIDGAAYFSKLFGRGLKSHDVLGVLKSNYTSDHVNVSNKIVKQYNEMPELIIKYHLANHPNFTERNLGYHHVNRREVENNIGKNWKIQKGDLIFCEYDKNTKQVLSMGKHFRYLWTYRNRIWDFQEVCIINVDKFKTDTLFTTDEMFGYSFSDVEKKWMKKKESYIIDNNKSSKSGKIHFNFAKHIDNTGRKADIELPGAGSPHASSYETYLKQDRTNSDDTLNDYGDRLKESGYIATLAGRKYYRRTSAYMENIGIQRINQPYKVRCKNVLFAEHNNLPEFKFRVNFECLSNKELSLLIFALSLGDNSKFDTIPQTDNLPLCHHIGYGKNLGIGAIKIQIDAVNLIDYSQGNFKKQKKSFVDYTKEKSYQVDLSNLNYFNFMRFTNKTFSYPDDFTYERNGNRRNNNLTIFNWYSNTKKQDMENRLKQYTTTISTDTPETESKPLKKQYDSKEEFDKDLKDLQDSF